MHPTDRTEHTVDAIPNLQPGRFALQVNIAGAGLEGVVQGRIDQPHHRARVFADRHQRQFFHTQHRFAVTRLFTQQAGHGTHGLFLARQVGIQVTALHQTQARPGGQRKARPLTQALVKRIGNGRRQRTALQAQAQAAPARSLGKGQAFEVRARLLQILW